MTCTTTVEQSGLVEAIAQRVVELLAETPPAPPRLVDAAALARMFGISRATVYDHADRFGAVRLAGPGRSIIRFDVERARQAWTRCDVSEGSQPVDAAVTTDGSLIPIRQPHRRRRTAARSGTGLLPVKGLAE